MSLLSFLSRRAKSPPVDRLTALPSSTQSVGVSRKRCGTLPRMIRALRAPLALIAALFVVGTERFVKTMIAVMPDPWALRLVYLRLDYWLSPVNLAVSGAVVILAVVILEVKHRAFGPHRRLGHDVVAGAACLALACVPAFASEAVLPGRLQLLFSGLHVLALWAFMLANARLWIFERYVTGTRWFDRLTTVAFPVADFFFYDHHRRRLATERRWIRLAPMVVGLVATVAVVASQVALVATAVRAARIPTFFSSTYFARHESDGFSFAVSSMDARGGIWHYDAHARDFRQVVPLIDAHRFHATGDAFFAYDRGRSEVLRVDARTNQVVWRRPFMRGFGTVELVARNGVIAAAAEGGHIELLDEDGRGQASRTFPFRANHPQLLRDGRLAFVAGDPTLRIVDAGLTQMESIPLPGSEWWTARRVREEDIGKTMTGLVWSDYDDRSEVLYIASLWGEIFRYDVAAGRWLPSLRARRGLRSIAIDRENRVLFASTYLRGVLDVLDLDSGARVATILTKPLVRFVNPDPERRIGLVNTLGHGLQQFDYRALVPSRRAGRHERAG